MDVDVEKDDTNEEDVEEEVAGIPDEPVENVENPPELFELIDVTV